MTNENLSHAHTEHQSQISKLISLNYEELRKAAVRVARRFGPLTPYEIDDIINDAVLALLQCDRRQSIRLFGNKELLQSDNERFLAYAYGILRNKARDRVRERYKSNDPSVLDRIARTHHSSPSYSLSQRLELNDMVSHLESRYREVVKLWLSGISYPEISKQLGITETLARKRVQRAKQMLVRARY